MLNTSLKSSVRHLIAGALAVMISAIVCIGALPAGQSTIAENQSQTDPILDKWGIKVLGITNSAAGYMLDFRYRVLDAEKAAPLMQRQAKPYVLDEASGARFQVMRGSKVGSMRQTGGKPEAGRNYTIIFVNPGRHIKPGNKVSVAIGDFRAENLVVR